MTDERTVPVLGGRLYARVEGEGTPVVLLHAGIVDLRAWDGLVPLLLQHGLKVIRYDARGYGRSETDDVPYSNRADVRAILDAFEIERGILVGSSRGATIALDTAAEDPQRVAGVVTLGANLGGYDLDPTPEELALYERAEELEEGDDHDAAADLDVRLWVDGPGQPADRVPAAIRESVRAMALDVYRPARPRGRPIPLDPPAAERLDALTMPILAIAGALDVSDIVPTARYLEAQLPAARAVVLPGVAHMIALEQPDATAELVAGFVETVRTNATPAA